MTFGKQIINATQVKIVKRNYSGFEFIDVCKIANDFGLLLLKKK